MSRELDWNDESVKASTGGKINRYKGEQGRIDTIRILSAKPSAYFLHAIQEKRFYGTCTKETHDTCPLCDKGYQAQEKYAAYIVHISKKKGDKLDILGEPKVWAFGADKFEQLREIYNEDGAFNDYDIRIMCTDSQFQKLSLTPRPGAKTKFDKTMAETAEEQKTMFEKFLTPETPEKLLKRFNGTEDAAEDADEGFVNTPNSEKTTTADLDDDMAELEKALNDDD